MPKSSFVHYCHDIIISELRAVTSSPDPELWEVKIWYCVCWRACISSGLAPEFEAEMYSEMGRDRIQSITQAIADDCLNGIKFYRRLIELYELLRRRAESDKINALNYIVSRIYPHTQEIAMLAKGTKLHAVALAGIWNTRPNLLQVLRAIGNENLLDFKSLDDSDLSSQPSLLGAAGRNQSLLTIFMRTLLAQRDDIDSFKALRSVMEKDGSLQVVEPQLGLITASLIDDDQPSLSSAVKFCLHGDGQRSVCALSSAANSFSKARKNTT